MQNKTNLTVQEAHKILKAFDCINNNTASTPNKALIREALLLTTDFSDYEILGICADTAEQGILALKSYADALGYEPNLNIGAIAGPIYIKFNPKTNLCYIDSYQGNHRGVLVSCQSAYDGGVNEMYGHLPIDLFLVEA